MINKFFDNPLNKFLLWLFFSFLICIIGVFNVNADTYTVIGDKADITVVLVSTNYSSQPFNVPKNSSYNFNQVLEVDYLVSNYNFEANKHYQLETHLTSQTFTNANYYSVSGLNGEQCLISYQKSIFTGSYPRWSFQCPHATNNITLTISNSNHQYLWSGDGIYTWQTSLLSYSNTSLSTGDDSNDIINNNNQNTQAIIDSNKENFNTCYTNYFNIYNVGSTSSVGGIVERVGSENIKIQSTSSIYDNLDSKTLKTLAPNLQVGKTYILDYVQDGVKNYIYLGSGFVWYKGESRTITQSDLDSMVYFYISTKGTTGYYKKLTIQDSNNYTSSYIPFGETCTNKLDETNSALNELNDNITNDDVDSSSWANFFNNFTTDTFGLTSIITAPLNLIQSLSSSTCTDLQIPLPYLNNKYLILPCMSSIYSQYFGNFFTLYQTITFGIIAYWVCVRIFNLVKDFKNPEHDEIEVVDL